MLHLQESALKGSTVVWTAMWKQSPANFFRLHKTQGHHASMTAAAAAAAAAMQPAWISLCLIKRVLQAFRGELIIHLA